MLVLHSMFSDRDDLQWIYVFILGLVCKGIVKKGTGVRKRIRKPQCHCDGFILQKMIMNNVDLKQYLLIVSGKYICKHGSIYDIYYVVNNLV